MYKRPFIIFSILLLSFLQVLAYPINQIDALAEIRESQLFDLSGRLIRKIGSERAIQIGDLAPGVYLLRVQTNGKQYMERFLKHGL